MSVAFESPRTGAATKAAELTKLYALQVVGDINSTCGLCPMHTSAWAAVGVTAVRECGGLCFPPGTLHIVSLPPPNASYPHFYLKSRSYPQLYNLHTKTVVCQPISIKPGKMSPPNTSQ